MTLKGADKNKLVEVFNNFFEKFSAAQPDRPEPMLNILAWCDHDCLVVHLIPRKLHRPCQYFAEGKDKIILSPASVDIGGVIITPREEDFIKINKNDVEDIFRQVCLDEDEMHLFFNELL